MYTSQNPQCSSIFPTCHTESDYTYGHVYMDELSSIDIRHILSFVVFVKLLVVEVSHLKIVISRLGKALCDFPVRCGLHKICCSKNPLLAINIGSNKKEKCATLYIIDF